MSYIPFITVAHSDWIGKNYFATAKCATYGKGFVTGSKYSDLQELLNENIRLAKGVKKRVHPYLVWDEYAPANLHLPNLYNPDSFKPALQKYIYLTEAGKKQLQEVLVEHYGVWMKDFKRPEFNE